MNKFITKAVLMAGLVTSATLAFGEGIASANVVGYAQTALKSGFTGAGAQFVPVSGEAMDLTDIIPTGYGDTCEGAVYVQQLDECGRAVKGSYCFWYDTPNFYGWYDESDNKVEKGAYMLKAGEALWVSGSSASEGLQSSGQVPNVGINIMLRSGAKLVCNPTPVAINYNDDDGDGKFIAVGGYGSTCEGSVYVQQLDECGRAVKGSYCFWYDTPDYYGWYDESDTFVSGKKLSAGDTLWVLSNSENNYLSIPVVLK